MARNLSTNGAKSGSWISVLGLSWSAAVLVSKSVSVSVQQYFWCLIYWVFICSRACLLNCTLVKRYHQEMVGIEFFSKTAKPYTTSYFLYIEILAVAISYFARMISTGKLAFPPPPQPVMLCPVHTKSAICPCLLSSKDADKSLEKKVSYSPL